MPGKIELCVYASGAIGRIPVCVYIALIVIFVIGSVFFFWRKGLREGFRCTILLLLAEWVFLILGTSVLFRESGADFRINLVPLSSYFDIAENSYLLETSAINILNVVMFIPVGLLSGFMVHGSRFKVTERRWLWVLAFGTGLSVLVELLQFILKRGLCETDDVIHNMIGCVIGFAIYQLSTRLVKDVQAFL